MEITCFNVRFIQENANPVKLILFSAKQCSQSKTHFASHSIDLPIQIGYSKIRSIVTGVLFHQRL